MNDAGEEQAITAEHVDTALNAVHTTVFPHRALEIQKLWMNRRMFKPMELTTRQTAAAINRLNNALPLFPNGVDASKFSEVEIIGLLEWSLPSEWRTKFDLDGYIPTLHSKARLIEACEAIERNAPQETSSTKAAPKNKPAKKKSENSASSGAKSEPKFYCKEHGKNFTHSTSDCRTLKNRAKSGNQGSGQSTSRSFTSKNFRKEINQLAKSSSKKEVLDLYASAVKREQAKLAKNWRNENREKSFLTTIPTVTCRFESLKNPVDPGLRPSPGSRLLKQQSSNIKNDRRNSRSQFAAK